MNFPLYIYLKRFAALCYYWTLCLVVATTLTRHQQFLIKSHLVDINNRFNGIFPSFTPLHSELFPSHRIIDNFLDHFVFNLHSKQKDDRACTHQLDNMVIKASSSPSTAIVVIDTSIKNDVATLILHIHTYNNPITKTVHHIVHVTSTEAECYELRSLGLDNRTTFVLSNTRELNRELFYKLVYLI